MSSIIMSIIRKCRDVRKKNVELVKAITSYREEIKDLKTCCKELREELGNVRTYDYEVLLQDFSFYKSNAVFGRMPDKLPEEYYRKRITEVIINKMVEDKVIKFDISSNPRDAVFTAHVRLRLLDN